jgi:ParB-like chromosome segregation protein Spo0J
MKIINIPINDLKEYENNSRTHSEEQITQIVNSIKEFGFTNPILIDNKNLIIAGHGRLLAAKKLDLKEVPTIVLNNLSEEQKKAYIIADNQLAMNAGWDFEMLKNEIMAIADDIDLNLLGFNEQELANIIDGLELIEPELQEQEYKEVFNVIINCEDENHQEKTYNELQEKGYECQVQSL